MERTFPRRLGFWRRDFDCLLLVLPSHEAAQIWSPIQFGHMGKSKHADSDGRLTRLKPLD